MNDAEREARLRTSICSMPWERFEQLVYELAYREDPSVERLRHPDGGADTILPRTGNRAERVWQAKHYPNGIGWKKCTTSLVAAIARWEPTAVTFVFSRDLSAKLKTRFAESLADHSAASAITVDYWGLSDLVRRLGEHPDLVARFFGREDEDTLNKLERFVRAGGKLESASDLVERAQAIGSFAAELDTRFDTVITVGGPRMVAPDWATLPYMEIEVRGATGRVQLTSWVREGVEVTMPSFGFTPDEQGQAARTKAVEALAKGEPAHVKEGFEVAVVAPELVYRLFGYNPFAARAFTLLPGEPTDAKVTVTYHLGKLRREFELRPVPGPANALAAFAGYIEGVLFELSLMPHSKGYVVDVFSFKGHLVPKSAKEPERGQLSPFMYAVFFNKRITLTSRLLPGSGRISGHVAIPKGDD